MAETLWKFAAEHYQRAGVAEHCLNLQDSSGADVNMLLAAAWLAEQDYCWQQEQVHELIALCAKWREHCILPLRAVRRYLKSQLETPALYTQIKALELEAEMQQLHRLHAALQAILSKPRKAAGTDLLAINLQTYFACLNPDQKTVDLDQPTSAATNWRALIEALRK